MKLFNIFANSPGYGQLKPDEELRQQDDEYKSFTPNENYTPVRSVLSTISIIFLSVGLGALFGYWLRGSNLQPRTLLSISDHTPIPMEIFTERHDVPFIPDVKYIGPSREANKNWAELTRASDSIFLVNPKAYGLQDPGIRAPFFIFQEPPASAKEAGTVNDFYVLNSLHQLHCVHMLRKRYNQLIYQPDTVTPLSKSPLDADWITHLEHCFEYLRLSITCGDYMVFESDSPPGSPKEYWEDGLGWGVVHSCINWEKLMDYQQKQIVLYNSTWEQKWQAR